MAATLTPEQENVSTIISSLLNELLEQYNWCFALKRVNRFLNKFYEAIIHKYRGNYAMDRWLCIRNKNT